MEKLEKVLNTWKHIVTHGKLSKELTECILETIKLLEELKDRAKEANPAIQEAYREGYKRALWDYAWWQSGIQYVGCGAKTLEQALKEAGIEE